MQQLNKMKKVREILYEKFDTESDPIKDMGVGRISFGEEFQERYKTPQTQLYKKWIKFINQFKGKWICGNFHLYEHKGDYSGKMVYAEVKFTKITMNDDGILNLETADNRTYCIKPEEKYMIKD